MGRPAHNPDPTSRRLVEAMAGYGVPEANIARVLRIDPKTLRRHYRDELDTGAIKANSKVAESLYQRRERPHPGRQSDCRVGGKVRSRAAGLLHPRNRPSLPSHGW